MAGMNYEKLVVYDKAYKLVLDIYKITREFPRCEEYGMTSQMRRSSSSIIANIVEGSSRNTYQELKNFLYIARGSNEELKVFIKLSADLEYIKNNNSLILIKQTEEIGMMLNGMLRNIKKKLTKA